MNRKFSCQLRISVGVDNVSIGEILLRLRYYYLKGVI